MQTSSRSLSLPLKMIGYIFYIHLLLLLRRSYEWLYPLAFFLIVLYFFPFAFTPDPDIMGKFIPGYIWIAALLAILLVISPLFIVDKEDGSLEQWLLSPLPLFVLVSIKLLCQWLVFILPLILLLPLISVMFHLTSAVTWALGWGLLLGTPILILLGGLAAALTLGLRQQGVLLGLLILPLASPVLILGITLVQQVQAGLSIAGPLLLLAGLAVLALTMLPVAIAAALSLAVSSS